MYAATSQRSVGYGTGGIRTHRDTEYDAFSKVTSMLRQSLSSRDRSMQINAASKNNDLWIILADDLSHDKNTLPNEVRANLLSLALFSIRRGHAVIAGTATADALIEINMSIMKGLRAEVAS